MKTLACTLNAMAGKTAICPVLQKHYRLPAENKQRQLETQEAKFLFGGLPAEVATMFRQGFLCGAHGADIPGWQEVVVKYFMANSRIIPALTVNPGTYTMLEKMYHFEQVEGVIDNYFLQSKAGGQALRNRYYAVTSRACEYVSEVISEKDHCLMIDIGSGPGRNGIDICRKMSGLNGNIQIDCIDIDPDAIKKGQELINYYGIKQVEFIQKSMTRLQAKYPGNVDFGLLIGILCGLTREERIALLAVLKSYFRKGARLIAASLLESMAEEDLLCAYTLRETTGWGLQYPAIGELKDVFEAAGWKYEGFFQEEPTRFYEIGVGIA